MTLISPSRCLRWATITSHTRYVHDLLWGLHVYLELNDYYSYHIQQIEFVINIMEFSGRIDHILSQINTLFKVSSKMKDIDVYLMTKNSLAWLLKPGNHSITVPDKCVQEEQWCSYVPVGAAATATTTGFKWDLSKCFKGLAKSSGPNSMRFSHAFLTRAQFNLLAFYHSS